jgi:hypothetical protein
VQKLPMSKKGDAWRRACVDVLISREGSTFISGRSRKDILRVNYDLYNSIFSEEDFKYIVNPFNVEEGFPAHPQNMNIIKPKIDLLIGEETKRPFNFKVFSTNDETISQIQDFKKQSLIKEYLDSVTNGDNPEETQKKLQEIDRYIKNKYATAGETMAYNSLKYLREYLNIDHELIKTWKDGLIAGEEIAYVGIVNGEPMCERCNPYTCTYDNDPDIEFIEDGDWFVRRFLMSPGGIYDRFQSIMDEEDLDKLLQMLGGDSLQRRPSDVNYNSIIYKDKIISDITNDEFFKGQLLPVWHCTWKSFKKIAYIRYTDEDGEEIEDVVDETYKLDDEEKAQGKTIEWDWITEVWEGYRIGTDIFLDIKPVQYQYQSLDNPKTTKLPYVGVRHNCTNTRNRSLVDLLKPLQYMYIVVWYRLELALSRDKGKIINMDITQIPKSMGISVEKWMHYLSALGVNFINPYEEGWDIPGREGGKPAQYNQMSSQDLSMSKVIMDYIQLLNKIEDMAGEFSGISRQRQGEISSSELVGNVQRATVQSSHITEPLYEIHNIFKKKMYAALLNTAKYAWGENKKKRLTFIADDYTRMFLEVNDDFLYSDFDIFVSDATQENQNLESLRSLIQPAMQNGATLSDAALILTTQSISEIKNKLKEIEEKRAQNEQEQQKAQQEAQQQMHQEEQAVLAEQNRIKEEDSIRKAETAIQVAMIGAESRKQSTSSNSPIPEDNSIELAKLQLEQESILLDDRYNQNSLDEEIRKNKALESLKAQEIEVKRKQASKPVSKSK